MKLYLHRGAVSRQRRESNYITEENRDRIEGFRLDVGAFLEFIGHIPAGKSSYTPRAIFQNATRNVRHSMNASQCPDRVFREF